MICRLLMFLCAIPLAIYPGILMAGLMGLAAEPNQNANPLTVMAAKSFLWSSLLYPIWYSVGIAVSNRSPTAGAAISVSYLCICLALFAAWYWLSTGGLA